MRTMLMLNKLSFTLACCALLVFGPEARAFPTTVPQERPAAPEITLVGGYCGLNFHRIPEGYCVKDSEFYIYPPPQPPTELVAPLGCPYGAYQSPDGRCFAPAACTTGYYLGPYGQCFPYWRHW